MRLALRLKLRHAGGLFFCRSLGRRGLGERRVGAERGFDGRDAVGERAGAGRAERVLVDRGRAAARAVRRRAAVRRRERLVVVVRLGAGRARRPRAPSSDSAPGGAPTALASPSDTSSKSFQSRSRSAESV